MPTIPEALAIARQHHQAGNLQAAQQICRQILAADPNNADALHLLGVVSLGQGQAAFAVQCLTRAVQLNNAEPAFYANLGAALQAVGQIDQSIACFHRSIELDPKNAAFHYNLATVFHLAGNLNDALLCYRRAAELNPNLPEIHTNLGYLYQTQGHLDDAIACFRRALELRPDLAEAHNHLGNVYWVQGRLDMAFNCYRRAVELKPDLAEAHTNLANVYQFEGKLDEAADCCRRALALKPDYPVAHNNLANALLTQGLLDESLASYKRAIELQPGYAEAHSNCGYALHQLGRFHEAFASYQRALDLHTDLPQAHFCRANLKLLMGDFESGLPEYDWRFKTNELVHRKFNEPRWNGAPLGQRTILLHAEQGLGDTIQFARYAAVIKRQNPTAIIILECQPPLQKLLTSLQGVDRLVARGEPLPPFDVHAPLMALPGILKTTLDTIPADVPYLFADAALVEHWRERLQQVTGLRIGINWRGRPISRLRGIPLESWRLVTELPGVRCVSLQKGATPDELAAAAGNGPPIIDLGDDLDATSGPFMDTAAVMMNLDLVIACDTSVPHLAGALGVPVWLALPFVPDWRWLLNRADSPWYPTMRLFRQKAPSDWSGAFEEIQSALRDSLENRSNSPHTLAR